MYIISKHKDYYDSIGDQFGVDKSVIYKRESIELKGLDLLKFTSLVKKSLEGSWDSGAGRFEFPNHTKFEMEAMWYLIHFCGVNHIMLRLTYLKAGPKISPYMTPEDITYHLYGDEIIDPLLEAANSKMRKSKYNRKIHNKYSTTIENIKKIEALDFSKLINELKVPIFVLEVYGGHRYSALREKGILNPILSDYSFYKVKTPPAAFQEVQQYISGVLGVDSNPVIVTDDKYKILAAGFDDKTSFRKDPGKPKPRKSKKD